MTFFDGPTDEVDKSSRLSRQHEALKDLMRDGKPRTLHQISEILEQRGVKCPPASASAQLRHLRKPRFGSWEVSKLHLGHGLYEYSLGLPGVHKVLPTIVLSVEEAQEAWEGLSQESSLKTRIGSFLVENKR